MGDIYCLAKRVVVDCGEENETIAPALWLITLKWRKPAWKGVFVPFPPTHLVSDTEAKTGATTKDGVHAASGRITGRSC